MKKEITEYEERRIRERERDYERKKMGIPILKAPLNDLMETQECYGATLSSRILTWNGPLHSSETLHMGFDTLKSSQVLILQARGMEHGRESL